MLQTYVKFRFRSSKFVQFAHKQAQLKKCIKHVVINPPLRPLCLLYLSSKA